jgi:N-carbamoylputrescine amidase
LRNALARGLFAFGNEMDISQYPPAERRLDAPVVACVQMEPRIGETRENVNRSIQRIEEADARGVPELTNTGYAFADRDEAFALAEDVPSVASAQAWADAAQRLGVYIVAGIAERDVGRLYNSAVFVVPSEITGLHRKLHLWNEENLVFEPGDRGVPVFHTPLGRIAIVICYDGWFPEVYRIAAHGRRTQHRPKRDCGWRRMAVGRSRQLRP